MQLLQIARTALIIAGAALISSCSYQKNGFNNLWQPPCKEDRVGTVCFHNDGRKEVKVNIGKTETEVLGGSTICVDIYAGKYEYKAKGSGLKVKDEVQVASCRESHIHVACP